MPNNVDAPAFNAAEVLTAALAMLPIAELRALEEKVQTAVYERSCESWGPSGRCQEEKGHDGPHAHVGMLPGTAYGGPRRGRITWEVTE